MLGHRIVTDGQFDLQRCFVNKHPYFRLTTHLNPHLYSRLLIDCEMWKHYYIRCWVLSSNIVYIDVHRWQNLKTLIFTHWATGHSGPRVRLEGEGTVRKYLWLIIQRRGATSGAACIIHKYSLQQKRFQSSKDWNTIVMIHKTKIFCRKIEPI